MASLIDIRRRIKSTKNTQQITKAMKMVSASRLRRASERAMSARPYAERIAAVHSSILGRMAEITGTLYQEQEGKTLVVMLAGDKGLCGSFNANIYKQFGKIASLHGLNNLAVLPIGKKAVDFCKKEEVETLEGYPGIFRSIQLADVEEITERLVALYEEGKYGRIVILFNKFKNVLIQEVTEQQVLPLSAEVNELDDNESGPEHLAEPNLEEILEELSPRVVMTAVYQALLESCASEHAARMTAMDAATNNAKDMIGRLTLEMNKARQAAITKELIEIVSGAAAL